MTCLKPSSRCWGIREGFGFLPVALAFALAALAPGAARAFLGDADVNGIVAAPDTAAISAHLIASAPLTGAGLSNADVNQDGRVDVADLIGLHVLLAAPPPKLENSSPLNGEGDVSIDRETILYFTNALDPGTIGPATFGAEFGGNPLAITIHPSPDLRRVTLFYSSPLPDSARVRVTVNGDGLRDVRGLAVDADDDGVAGGIASIDFDTLSLTTFPGTSVAGRVFASELDVDGLTSVNFPLQNAQITVDGMEGTLVAFTDAQGNFTLSPAPAGKFFVHIDGRTAIKPSGAPDDSYYPYVGKAWESSPGKMTNIGEIYLPLVPPGTLKPVSMTEDTVIGFPASIISQFPQFAGVNVMVPKDSLFANDGTRGGMVGIAPVPPDRMPGKPPGTLNPAIVISIQTDGATNFDKPVPVCFPNLPDPVSGLALPPGSKSALWDFNHDTGAFEVSGPMTVSADGRFVCSDPGFGVRAPGWHFTSPNSECGGDPPPPPCPSSNDSLNCIFSIINGALDCSSILLPQAKALVWLQSGIVNGLQVTRNCVQEMEFGGGATWGGCGGNIAQAAIGVGIDCVQKLNPLSMPANIISCAGSVGTIVNNCFPLIEPCIMSAPGRRKDLQTAAADFEAERIRLEAVLEHYFYIFGGRDWFDVADEAEGEDGADLILAFVAAAAEASDASAKISAAELAALLAMPRPAALSGAELQATVDRWNRTMDYWSMGIFSVAQVPGGQNTDFIETQVLVTKMEAGAAAAPNLSQDFDETIGEIRGTIVGDFGQTPGPTESRTVYFAVEPLTGDGVLQRGVSPTSGIIANIYLKPTELHRVHWVNPKNLYVAQSTFWSEAAGFSLKFPKTLFFPSARPDADGDGLADDAEFTVGTSVSNPDTDGDGINDGPELQQGTNPLDGLPAATGVIATANTPGTAVDIAAFNDIAAVADSAQGVSVFNVFNGMDPIIIAQVDTPGDARAVAISGSLVAVADGVQGLEIVDISDPPVASILHQVMLGSTANAVATAGPLAVAGLSDRSVALVHMPTGTVLDRIFPPNGEAIQDVAFGGNHIYVAKSNSLHTLTMNGGVLGLAGSINVGGSVGSTFRRRLFVGRDIAYLSHLTGYRTFSLADPVNPVELVAGNYAAAGWKQIVDNGSGLGIAPVGPNSNLTGVHDIDVYDVSDPTQTAPSLVTFGTPGVARAVSIYNGLAYVADGDSGLQAINYLSYDDLGAPPTISISTPEHLGGTAEEGQLIRVAADVTDDVQVRNVEFYVDGAKVATDGNFPFEIRVVAPLLSAQSSIVLRAKATDTGGNIAWTTDLTLNLVPDGTPPLVASTSPDSAQIVGPLFVVSARFNEPIDPSTVTAGALTIFDLGPDGGIGGGDDVLVGGGFQEFDADVSQVSLSFGTQLPAGFYWAIVAAGVADLKGNVMTAPYKWKFWVGGFADGDGDGLDDTLEAGMGLNPGFFDSDGDGLADGLEDPDSDGLTNSEEALLGTIFNDNDTDNDLLTDGNEDTDLDGLVDKLEFDFCTNPFSQDTDNDGWNDETETITGSDPLDPASTPKWFVEGAPDVAISLPGLAGVLPLGTTIGQPPVAISVPGESGVLPIGVTVGQPSVALSLPGPSGLLPIGMTVGQPPIVLSLPGPSGILQQGLTIGEPDVEILLNP